MHLLPQIKQCFDSEASERCQLCCQFRQPLPDLQVPYLLKPHLHPCLLLRASVQRQCYRLLTDEPNLGQLPGYVSAAGMEQVSVYALYRHHIDNHADPRLSRASDDTAQHWP